MALRPVLPPDYQALHRLEISEPLGPRWRFRGSTPGTEQWAQVTWSSTLAQFLVVSRSSETPLGTAAIYQANFQDGFAYLAAASFQAGRRAPAMMLGIALLIRYTFACWSFRKLYMEVLEYNYGQFASGSDRLFRMEGRLRDHAYLNGRYWDQIHLALYREDWEQYGQSLVDFELAV